MGQVAQPPEWLNGAADDFASVVAIGIISDESTIESRLTRFFHRIHKILKRGSRDAD